MISLVRNSAAPLIALVLSGCASLGGNIQGDFICKAPGGTCSPTTNIDDQAIAVMGDETKRSGPLTPSSAVPSPGALKVVLPARIDRFGRWRDESVVYVDRGPLAASVNAVSGPSKSERGNRLSLAELAAGAPEVGALEGFGARQAGVAPSAASAPPSSDNPVAKIQAEVDARLRQAPRFVSQPVIQGQVSRPVQETPSTPKIEAQPVSEVDVDPSGKAVPAGTAVAPSFPASQAEGQ